MADAADIPGMIRRWRADSVTVADGAGIPSITFSDGLVLNASPSQPTYAAAGIGGRPAARFTAASSQSFHTTASPSKAQPITVVFVLTPTNMGGSDIQPLHHGLELVISASKWLIYAGSPVTGARVLTNGTPTLVEATFGALSGAHSRIYSDGTLDNTGYANTTGLSSGMYVGRHSSTATGRYFGGDIAEVVQYDHALTDAERVTLASYVQGHYGITVAGAVVTPTETADCHVRVGGALVPAVTRYRIGGVLVPTPPA